MFFVGTIAGLLIGLATGVLRTTPLSKNGFVRALQKILNAVIAVYVEIFRGTPMMVQAMVIYWGYAFATGGNTLPLIPSGIIIVSINTGAYMAEIVRGGIISIDKGLFEGASSIGMSHVQAMLHVILPQVLRNILPSVSNEFVINIKDTSVLNVIGVTEGIYNDTVAISKESQYYTPKSSLPFRTASSTSSAPMKARPSSTSTATPATPRPPTLITTAHALPSRLFPTNYIQSQAPCVNRALFP